MHVCTFFVALKFKYKLYAGMHFFLIPSIVFFFADIFLYSKFLAVSAVVENHHLKIALNAIMNYTVRACMYEQKTNFMQIISAMRKKRETFAINLRRPLALALACCFF